MEDKNKLINNTVSIFNILNFNTEIEKRNNKKNKYNLLLLWKLAEDPLKNKLEIDFILKNDELSKVFYRILKEVSLFYFPKINAASSDTIQRSCAEFEISSFQSKKNNNLCYIKLKFLVTIDKKIKYLYVGNNQNFIFKELPEMINYEIQFILDKKEDLFKLIQDPDAEIFIR